MFKYLIVFLLLLSVVTVNAEKKAKVPRFAWQSDNPIQPPDFKGYFPNDPEAGKRLDVLIKNRYKGINNTKEYLEIVRKGFRTIRNHRTLVLARIGKKYIWNKKEQNPLAIELMYHATNNPNKGERHYAIYFGLSVVKPKTPAILKALVDIAMTIDDPNDTGRIAWGSRDQKKELIEYLKPYLVSKQEKVSKHAQALKNIFSGKLNAREYWKQNQRAKAQPLFGSRMGELREQLAKGDSATRRKVIDTMRKHFLGLIIKDHVAWLKAYIAAAKDPDPKVRRWVAQNVGGTYVWNAKEVNSLAVDLLLELAHDKDRQVRYDASYYGLNRLPKGHPAQARVDKVNQANRDRKIEKMRQALLKAVKDGKFQMVGRFLRQIKPNDRRSYRKGDREKVQALYNEISKKISEARQLSKNVQTLAK
jgi:hypothetical protein